MNENLNNENNNYVEPQKNEKGKNILIVVLSIIIVLLIALLVYVAFFRDKEKDNTIEEDTPIKEVTISKELEDKMKYVVLNIPVSNILQFKNLTYKDIYESYVIHNVLDKIASLNDLKKEEWDKTTFNYDEIYVYNGGHTKEQVKYYNGRDVMDKVEELFNYKLNLNTKNYGGCEFFLNGSCVSMQYDSSIDKFVVYYGGGTGGHIVQSTILDTNFNSNIYKINYVLADYSYYEGATSCGVGEKYSGIDVDISCSNIDTDEKRDNYAKEHKDELPQYEVSFKINGDKYEFLDIKKIN